MSMWGGDSQQVMMAGTGQVQLTCPPQKLEQSHLYSGPSDEIRVTYGRRETEGPQLSSILKLPQLSFMRKQGGRDEARLSPRGWPALGVQVATGGLGCLCFSSRPRAPPFPSLARGWSLMDLDPCLLVYDTSNEMFLWVR